VAQSVHALADFSVEHPQAFKEWQSRSNYVCCLETSRFKMIDLIDRLSLLKIKYHIFFEPDIGNEMTAIAVESLPKERHKKLFKKFKLTLS
jgi:hypothetical protein